MTKENFIVLSVFVTLLLSLGVFFLVAYIAGYSLAAVAWLLITLAICTILSVAVYHDAEPFITKKSIYDDTD